MGRVTSLVVPGVEFAMTEHVGNDSDMDRDYGSLAT